MFNIQELNAPEATAFVSFLSGSSFSVRSYSGCLVNGVKFLTYNRDNNRNTHNSGIIIIVVFVFVDQITKRIIESWRRFTNYPT